MNKSIIVKPPESINNIIKLYNNRHSLFLAGSIENGKAIHWQKQVENDLVNNNVLIFNPRRDDWDASWKMDVNNPKFYEQVTWELNALENSNIIAMYFAPGTQSPISLLEFGLNVKYKKLIVYCPQDFYRKGNIDVTCKYYGVPVHENYETWITNIKRELKLI